MSHFFGVTTHGYDRPLAEHTCPRILSEYHERNAHPTKYKACDLGRTAAVFPNRDLRQLDVHYGSNDGYSYGSYQRCDLLRRRHVPNAETPRDTYRLPLLTNQRYHWFYNDPALAQGYDPLATRNPSGQCEIAEKTYPKPSPGGMTTKEMTMALDLQERGLLKKASGEEAATSSRQSAASISKTALHSKTSPSSSASTSLAEATAGTAVEATTGTASETAAGTASEATAPATTEDSQEPEVIAAEEEENRSQRILVSAMSGGRAAAAAAKKKKQEERRPEKQIWKEVAGPAEEQETDVDGCAVLTSCRKMEGKPEDNKDKDKCEKKPVQHVWYHHRRRYPQFYSAMTRFVETVRVNDKCFELF